MPDSVAETQVVGSTLIMEHEYEKSSTEKLSDRGVSRLEAETCLC